MDARRPEPAPRRRGAPGRRRGRLLDRLSRREPLDGAGHLPDDPERPGDAVSLEQPAPRLLFGPVVALTWRTALALLAAAVSTTGCLPRGPAPACRRLLDDGTAYSVRFVAGPTGSPARLGTTKLTNAGPGPFSVYAFHEPSTGEDLGRETFLIDRVDDLATDDRCRYDCSPSTDGQGRFFVDRDQFVTSSDGVATNDSSVARLDPVTDVAEDLGAESNLLGTFAQGAAFAYTVSTTLYVRDLEQRETRFQRLQGPPAILNDGLYFAARDESSSTIQSTRDRLTAPPFDVPEALASGISAFTTFQADVPLPVLCRTMPGDTGCAWSVLDPDTREEQSLPAATGSVRSISPSGRFLFMVRVPDLSSGPPAPPTNIDAPSAETPGDQIAISLFDRALGTSQSATLAELSASYWRPGHDALRCVATAPGEPRSSLWRWVPAGDPAAVLPGQYPVIPITSDAGQWPFTRDGQFLLTFDGTSQTDKPTIVLRDAGAPTTALMVLNPTGTGVHDVRQLPDGRLIVSDWITDANQADIYLVDGAAGTMSPLAHGGNVVAAGATRVEAPLDWVVAGGAGSLSLIDLATGASTLLAENVHAVDVEAPGGPGVYRLAPGTRVAYISRNRVASPYDGLWLVSLP